MGRPSKLTDKQWAEIEKRLLGGEVRRALAREFGVTEAAIRQRLSSRVEKIKVVANQIVAAERGLEELPIASQIYAVNLAGQLRSISEHLAGAAQRGAEISHRLFGIAQMKVQEIDDAAPISDAKSVEALKSIDALTKLGNNASELGVNLLRANKETIEDMNKRERERSPLEEMTDEALDEHIARLSKSAA